ncbi:MAG: HPr kinase/phosphatase C-terminal domain-containing protein [Pseudomonadota bacterium]
MSGTPQTLHGTLVDVTGNGVLLRGPSGSGKSSIALGLIDHASNTAAPVFLVSDDRVVLKRRDDVIVGRAPDAIKGLLEIRGIGIVRMPTLEESTLHLIVDLVAENELQRYPDPEADRALIHGVAIPRVCCAARNPDAGGIIRAVLRFPRERTE